MQYLRYLTHISILSICTACISACGGGGGGGEKVATMQNTETIQTISNPQIKEPSSEPSTTVSQVSNPKPPTPPSPTIQLSGIISYDRVGFNDRLFKGLDYNTITALPARGISVEIRNASGTVIDATQTNDRGEYFFDAPSDTELSIRVIAELASSRSANYSIRVKDNTNSNALYILDGALVSTGSNDAQSRNLHAESGWNGNEYSQTRSSAPFAVLDSLYDAIQLITEASPNIVLPPLNVYWSENNIAIGGSLSEGKIGTSFYTSSGPAIYLLGAANNDSDEFDRAVVQHEFGHYVEHQLFRTESLGGSHNVNSLLDLRVAFGEAWGNAFSGMVSGDPVYRDSLGLQQSLGFSINVQNRSFGIQGWFSEGSIQSILFNLFDDENSGDDNLSLGFTPIFNALSSEQYLNHEGFASIYPFIEVLKQQNPEIEPQINRLMNSYSIFGTGFYGENESNSGGSLITLPVYSDLSPGGSTNVCSNSLFQNYNGIDVYRLIKVNIQRAGTYVINASKTSSFLNTTNPQIRVHQSGEHIASLLSSSRDSESGAVDLPPGTYILELFEQSNADTSNNNGGGLACFDVTID